MIKKILKWPLRILGSLVSLALLAVIGLVAFLSVTEYNPDPVSPADRLKMDSNATIAQPDQSFTVYIWNTGYAGLGAESDFFMDGGTMVNPPSQKTVEDNLSAITSFMQKHPADAWLLQEVDMNSQRTDGVDQFAAYEAALPGNSMFAYNYKCPFVPIPWPPLGRIEAGNATYVQPVIDENVQRISLPCPFKWPVRAANIKRCLLVTRVPLEGTDKELVLVNLHLEAYDDGEGKKAQTDILMQVLKEEYEKGNYVVAGGDFNQSFPGTLEAFPIADTEKWTPGELEEGLLPEGWQFAFDASAATCRLLDKPYDDSCQKYVIDGFILSPNVKISTVETVDLDFKNSDHNPVRLEFTLN